MRAFNESRDAFNSLAETRGDERISVTALMVKLLATVLEDHPMLNSSLINESIYLHEEINIGVAVALEQGLIVPVLHQANQMGLAELAASVNDLANRAKAGDLRPAAEVKNGTFTISNLGPFGIEQFDAIINPPQAAILAVGATQLEAVPAEDGSIRSRPMLRMTLSADHRIVDGAVAARFMADLKAAFEGPIRIPY
jgi:pyruvate dehydrogenase E2 component (dihydrolipoamide acetyltransferase)